VDDELRFLARLIADRTAQLRASAADESQGRGYGLVRLVLLLCDAVEEDAAAVSGRLPLVDPTEGPVLERELLRLRTEQNVLHELLAHYRGDAGRRDLPIGLAHLVDEIVDDLLPTRADPIIHLDSRNMYSTMPLLGAVAGLLRGKSLSEPHPVAFNLPALDPANALLSPILVHEVGHTAWRQGLQQALDSKADLATASDHLRRAAASGSIRPTELAKQFDGWRQEIMCDAVAAVLTGPSFLFASAVFLPAPAHSYLGTHPYPRDRLRYTLDLLDDIGWTPVLQRLVPRVLAWCRDLARDPQLTGHPAEPGLRDALDTIEPAISEVAKSAAGNSLRPEVFEDAEPGLFAHLDLGVPPVTTEAGTPMSPWLIIAGSWLHEIGHLGDEPESLAVISANARLNNLLIKAIELAGVSKLWGQV
jgi:hypothetical protein